MKFFSATGNVIDDEPPPTKPKWDLDEKITVFDLAREGVSDETCQLIVRMMGTQTPIHIGFTGRELWAVGKKRMEGYPNDHGITECMRKNFIKLFGDPEATEEWRDLKFRVHDNKPQIMTRIATGRGVLQWRTVAQGMPAFGLDDSATIQRLVACYNAVIEWAKYNAYPSVSAGLAARNLIAAVDKQIEEESKG